MKNIFSIVAIMFFLSGGSLLFAQVTVTAVKGDVTVRHGVASGWLPVQVGDVLKPEDSMRSGERSTATIVIDPNRNVAGRKHIVVPENVIIDLSDFRELTQDDLLLKLAMERVLAVPDNSNERENGLVIPQTTIVHGESKEESAASRDERLEVSRELGLLQLNGARVLYNSGYYATCVLRAKEVLRLYPAFSSKADVRFMIASSLEKANLNGEALTEYLSFASENLSARDQAIVRNKIEQLRKRE
jgi:hypothetical protein